MKGCGTQRQRKGTLRASMPTQMARWTQTVTTTLPAFQPLQMQRSLPFLLYDLCRPPRQRQARPIHPQSQAPLCNHHHPNHPSSWHLPHPLHYLHPLTSPRHPLQRSLTSLRHWFLSPHLPRPLPRQPSPLPTESRLSHPTTLQHYPSFPTKCSVIGSTAAFARRVKRRRTHRPTCTRCTRRRNTRAPRTSWAETNECTMF